ncbi:MAG: hypothetical protein KIS88_04635 [Anaerolineales bacterium]|nr:hypothetical protein [Anaerolineales bacterium]
MKLVCILKAAWSSLRELPRNAVAQMPAMLAEFERVGERIMVMRRVGA